MGEINFPKINLEGVKGVLLDIDNTIYHYESCHRPSLNILIKELAKIFSSSDEIINKELLNSRKIVNKRLQNTASSHSRFLYIQLTIEKILGASDFHNTLKLKELYWNTFLSKMKLNEHAKKFIFQCNSKNIPICCVTDLTTEIQFKKIVKLNIEDKINFIVTSEEAGIEKPNKIIFDLALEKIKLKYKDVIMVGDSTSKDILGAENLGIKSYLVKSR